MLFGIFTGIEVLFFLMGVMSTLTIGGLIWLKLRHELTKAPLGLLLVGIFTMIFAIGWSVSCVLEGEPQAGSMGMIIMFIPGLVLTSLGGRMAAKAIS